MMRKLMRNTAVAAGFAALLLTGACASHSTATVDTTDDVVQVTQSNSVVPAPGPAKIDSDGNIYSSSAAPGAGKALGHRGVLQPQRGQRTVDVEVGGVDEAEAHCKDARALRWVTFVRFNSDERISR